MLFKNSPIENILQTSLEMTYQVRVQQHHLVFFANHIAVSLKDDMVHRKGAGLVRAQHIHRAKILYGIEPLHDDFLPRHEHRAFGETDRHDHGKHLWRQSNGHCQRKEERLSPISFGKTIDQKYEGDHHHHKADHKPGKALYSLIKTRLHLLGGNGGRHRAEKRPLSRFDDDCAR